MEGKKKKKTPVGLGQKQWNCGYIENTTWSKGLEYLDEDVPY